MRRGRPAEPLDYAFALLRPGWLLLLIGSLYAAAGLSWRGGAFFALAAALGLIGTDLVCGVLGYRRAMRRPWPAVDALPDDAWDD